jgi:hypothetical protein
VLRDASLRRNLGRLLRGVFASAIVALASVRANLEAVHFVNVIGRGDNLRHVKRGVLREEPLDGTRMVESLDLVDGQCMGVVVANENGAIRKLEDIRGHFADSFSFGVSI